MESVRKGLLLWSNYVLPALLPFMISVNLLKATPFPLILSKIISPVTNKLFGISSYGIFTLISGLLSGYPMGAKLVSELYTEKKLSKKEASYLLSFCNNSGPLFILGTLGAGLLNDKRAGVYLLAIHYISALSIGIIRKKPETNTNYLPASQSFSIGKELKNSIYNGIEAIVMVGGYIIFFSIICTVIHSITINYALSAYAKGSIFGILEITNGCKELTDINPLSLSLVSGITAFGGLSVHSQSIGYISSTDLSSLHYIFFKVIHCIIAFLLCFLLYPLYAQ